MRFRFCPARDLHGPFSGGVSWSLSASSLWPPSWDLPLPSLPPSRYFLQRPAWLFSWLRSLSNPLLGALISILRVCPSLVEFSREESSGLLSEAGRCCLAPLWSSVTAFAVDRGLFQPPIQGPQSSRRSLSAATLLAKLLDMLPFLLPSPSSVAFCLRIKAHEQWESRCD